MGENVEIADAQQFLARPADEIAHFIVQYQPAMRAILDQDWMR